MNGKNQRESTDKSGRKSRGQNIEKKICPKCKHDRMWVSRGGPNSIYKFKCTKCQHIIK